MVYFKEKNRDIINNRSFINKLPGKNLHKSIIVSTFCSASAFSLDFMFHAEIIYRKVLHTLLSICKCVHEGREACLCLCEPVSLSLCQATPRCGGRSHHTPYQWLMPSGIGALVVLGVQGWALRYVLGHSRWLFGGAWRPWLGRAPTRRQGALIPRVAGPGTLPQLAASTACGHVTAAPCSFCTFAAG